MELYHGLQRRICSKKEEDISIIKNRERESPEVHKRSVDGRIYLTIKITTNVTGILCVEEGWKEENGIGLSIFEQLGN